MPSSTSASGGRDRSVRQSQPSAAAGSGSTTSPSAPAASSFERFTPIEPSDRDALVLPDGPDAVHGEITEKGYIAQSLARSRRAEAIQRLFADPPSSDVMVF